MDAELVILIIGLFFIHFYSSVGHGGASGYLALLSLTSFSSEGHIWLKQYAWSLNLIVAGIAFFYYYRAGYHNFKLTLPFVIASVPMAIIGSYVYISTEIYDFLLSIFLILAAIKLLLKKENVESIKTEIPNIKNTIFIGSTIGFVSGIIGIGGGILLTPILIINKWADPKAAAATSAIFIWLNSASGLIGSGLSNQLVGFDDILPFGIAVLVGGSIGSIYGSKIAKEESLRNILSLVLVIAASKRLLQINIF